MFFFSHPLRIAHCYEWPEKKQNTHHRHFCIHTQVLLVTNCPKESFKSDLCRLLCSPPPRIHVAARAITLESNSTPSLCSVETKLVHTLYIYIAVCTFHKVLPLLSELALDTCISDFQWSCIAGFFVYIEQPFAKLSF